MSAISNVIANVTPITKAKPQMEPAIGMPATLTFIPYALKIMVGIDNTMVTVANTFITAFTLFEITEANVPIVLLKIFV